MVSCDSRRAGCPVSCAFNYKPHELVFVADLARRMQARANAHGRLRGGEPAVGERIAAGTLDAMLWVLGITGLAPASGEARPERAPETIVQERALAVQLRRRYPVGSPEWLYLGGLTDALDFVLGLEAPFWWVPLPEVMRMGPPRRDEYGREIG